MSPNTVPGRAVERLIGTANQGRGELELTNRESETVEMMTTTTSVGDGLATWKDTKRGLGQLKYPSQSPKNVVVFDQR